MFYIIETDKQIELLSKLIVPGCYVEVVPMHDHMHSKLTAPSLLYVNTLIKDQGFILPINHTDGLNVSYDRVNALLSKAEIVYTYNKKTLLYYFMHKNIIDINLMCCLEEYDTVELPKHPSVINWYYSNYPEVYNINTIIPLPKLYERCENNYLKLKPIIEQYKHVIEDPCWSFYNNTATGVYYLLEQPGLKITYESFISLFTPNHPRYSILDNIVYNSYNGYNNTSRPTNSFNGINFAAIPKKETHRQAIIPKKDLFVEFDFDGYHVRLLAELVGYRFSQESVHTQLGRLYFDKEELTPEEYKESKQLTFQILYGGVPDKWRHIEFFDKVHELTQRWWKEFTDNGVVRAPISNKPFTTKLKEMNSNKLMNYILQSVETSRNITILKDLLSYLKDKLSQSVLYTYDAILIDFDKKDGKQVLEDIQKILSKGGYPVKYKYGTSLVLQ